LVILEQEGGVSAFCHHDGVMQVTDAAKDEAIHAMPRELKLVITARTLTDQIKTAALDKAVRDEFQSRLAVQIACGIQLLKGKLDAFAGYVALAYIAYNAGNKTVEEIVRASEQKEPTHVKGKDKTPPKKETTPEQWESMCRLAASLYHQFPRDVRIDVGKWQCDKNIPSWFVRFSVFDQPSEQELIRYEYLRSIQGCIRPRRPAIPCTQAVHGLKHVQDGTGDVACNPTRAGALDKLYNPDKLAKPYRDALGRRLAPIPEDNLPIKVLNGRMVKMPLASGPVAPQGNPFEGMI
jgi:hypothetical protein